MHVQKCPRSDLPPLDYSYVVIIIIAMYVCMGLGAIEC